MKKGFNKICFVVSLVITFVVIFSAVYYVNYLSAKYALTIFKIKTVLFTSVILILCFIYWLFDDEDDRDINGGFGI